MEKVELGKTVGIKGTIGWDEAQHFGESINNNKYCIVSIAIELRGGSRKFDNEVEGDGFPGTFRDRKLFEKTIRLMVYWLRSWASITC